MKLRYVAMSLLALGALVAGSVATVSVTGELAKSKKGASASKHQYCPPQAGGKKGQRKPHNGRGRKCGQGGGAGGGQGGGRGGKCASDNRQNARINQRARAGRRGNAANQAAIVQQNACRDARARIVQRQVQRRVQQRTAHLRRSGR